MPFTPFHMGPGFLFKSLLNTSFSLMIFGWAQFIMDIQPLIVLLSGEGHLHGFSHTFVGGSLIAVCASLSGKYIIDWAVNSKWVGVTENDMHFFQLRKKMPWVIVLTSAFVGTFSHVYLDAIMHSDVEPFYPFNLGNPFLGVVHVELLHKICVYVGLVGGGLYTVLRLIKSKQ